MSFSKKANVNQYGKLVSRVDPICRGGVENDSVKEDLVIAIAATSTTTIEIPAGCALEAVTVKVLDAPTGPATMDIGVTGGSATAFFDDLSTVKDVSGVSVIAHEAYPAAKTIVVTPVSEPTAVGLVRIIAHFKQFTAPDNSRG